MVCITPTAGSLPAGITLQTMSDAAFAMASGGLPMASGAPNVLQAGNAPILSRAVLELGQPQSALWPGTLIAPPAGQDTWIAQYLVWAREDHMVRPENGARWAFGTKRDIVQTTPSFVQTEMQRRGIEAVLDSDLIQISSRGAGLDLAATYAQLARNVVDLEVEAAKADLFTAPAGYGGNSLDLTGSEWDAVGGDSLTDIDVAVDALIAGNPGIGREDIRVVLTGQSKEAAFRDPTWATARASITDLRPATVERLQEYWGVGSVVWRDAYVKAAGGLQFSASSLWGNVAVVFVDPTLNGNPLDSPFGNFSFAKTFTYSGTASTAPYFTRSDNSFHFPWVSYDLPAFINAASGFLIFNTKA